MSHELRTPLNAMLGFAQLLELDRRQPLPADAAALGGADPAGRLAPAGDDQRRARPVAHRVGQPASCRSSRSTCAELIAASLAMVDADAKRRGMRHQHRAGRRHRRADGRHHARQADPDQPAEQRRQVQHRRRPHPRRQPAAAARHGRDRRHRHRPGHDGRAAGRAVPALQPARPRALVAGRHRHRPGDQPAPGRADGRLAARAQHRRRGLVLHPGAAARRRARHRAVRASTPLQPPRAPTTTSASCTTSRTTRPMSR